MKFEHIQLFMQVVEIGSISQAAKQGYITQQGLSQALKQLESELGIELFHRSNKGMELTDEGRKFYICGQRMMQAYNEFWDDIHEDDENNVFNLYLTNGSYNMLPYLNEAPFMKKNNWYFSYVERPAEELATLLNNHKGIGFFTTHGALDSSIPELLNAEFPIYHLGSAKRFVHVCHVSSPLWQMEPEERIKAQENYKCIMSSSTHDLSWASNSLRRTVCATDLLSKQRLLRDRDTYCILTQNLYRMYFDPREYVIFDEREAKTVLNYYVAFHLSDTEKNRKLEQELVRYLKEILEEDEADTGFIIEQ